MKVTTNKRNLLSGIKNVLGVIPGKTSLPILTSILFEASENNIVITGTDLEISIKTRLSAQVHENGKVTIPARLLNDIISELPELPLEINVDELNVITILCGKGKYKITGGVPEEFPQIDCRNFETGIKLDAGKLKSYFGKVSFAASEDELRQPLMGAYFQTELDLIKITATDGHRLSHLDLRYALDLNTENFIIPQKTIGLLNKILGSGNAEEPSEPQIVSISEKVRSGDVIIAFEPNQFFIKTSDSEIYSKQIDGKYPKYESVIPTGNDGPVILPREELISSLRRVNLLSNTVTHQVILQLGENGLKVSAQTTEGVNGEAEELIPLQSQHSFEIGFNANYLLEILKTMDGEAVEMYFGSNKGAVLFFPVEKIPNMDWQLLLMPIRLSED